MNEKGSIAYDKNKRRVKMKTQKNPEKGLSYESDGKMGKQTNDKNNKKAQDFFNTTQNSE